MPYLRAQPTMRLAPGVGMVVIDGVVRCQRSRNTPPAEKVPMILKAAPIAPSAGH
jgi:hypothetical protein